jgi:transposase
LAEYGIIIAQGIGHIARRLPEILEDGEKNVPGIFRQLLDRLGDHLKELDRQVGEREVQIQNWHRDNEASRKLAQIPGIGALTVSALVASIGDAQNFEMGGRSRPGSGGCPDNTPVGANSGCWAKAKRGDTYLRTLLIHDARAVIRRIFPLDIAF